MFFSLIINTTVLKILYPANLLPINGYFSIKKKGNNTSTISSMDFTTKKKVLSFFINFNYT